MRFIFRTCCVDLCQGDRFAQRGRLACGQSHLILHPVGTEMPRNQTVAQPGPRPERPAVCELTCVFLTLSFPANKILVVVEEIGTKVLKMCTFLHVNSFMLFFSSPPRSNFWPSRRPDGSLLPRRWLIRSSPGPQTSRHRRNNHELRLQPAAF